MILKIFSLLRSPDSLSGQSLYVLDYGHNLWLISRYEWLTSVMFLTWSNNQIRTEVCEHYRTHTLVTLLPTFVANNSCHHLSKGELPSPLFNSPAVENLSCPYVLILNENRLIFYILYVLWIWKLNLNYWILRKLSELLNS